MPETDSRAKSKSRIVDWTERRQELLLLPSLSIYDSMQIKVLGYLIERYRDSPMANGPARYSPQDRLYLNRRVMVVHEHLRLERGHPTRSRTDAEQRIQASMQRFAVKASGHDADVPETPRAFGSPKNWFQMLFDWFSATFRLDRPHHRSNKNSQSRPRTGLKRLVSRLSDPKQADLAALKQLNSFVSCLSNSEKSDVTALEQLNSWVGRDLFHVYLKLWRIRVLANRFHDRVLRELEARISTEVNRERTAEAMRECLGDEPVQLRLAALGLLGRIGNLDDISLFADLLRLPTEELSADERGALLDTMRAIAHRSDGSKNLHDFKRRERRMWD